MSGRPAPRRWIGTFAVAGFVLLWELAGQAGWLNPVLLSYPSEIARASAELIGSGELARDAWFTLRVFGFSLALACAVGLPVGLFIGYNKTAHDVLHPFLVTANSLPKIVLMPLIVLWLGIGMSANVFLGSLMASFPILMSVRAGVDALDPDLVRLARAYGANRTLLVRRIVIPAIAPYALAGLRVAVSYGMVGVLIAEFFGANRGLGYRMVLYTSNFEVPRFFACVVAVAAATLLLSAGVRVLEHRVLGWRPSAFTPPGM